MAMNSNQRASVLCVLLVAVLATASSARLIQLPESSTTDKVSLALYYETLCPYCSNFIVNKLDKLVKDNELISIVDLRLVPYGNAKINSDGTIICQHGKWECVLNSVEACAIDALPDLNTHFAFIHCVETTVIEGLYAEWKQCFHKLGLDSKPITDCSNGDRGKELILGYAKETGALQPPHEYVPWVTVNGEPLLEEYENFIAYICKAYKGPKQPNACINLSLENTAKDKETSELKVCARDKASTITTRPKSDINGVSV